MAGGTEKKTERLIILIPKDITKLHPLSSLLAHKYKYTSHYP